MEKDNSDSLQTEVLSSIKEESQITINTSSGG